jgi:hypothetical protein
LLRLRERYLALQKDRKEVIRLMVDSLPTFATLFRHAVIVAGGDPPVKRREVFRAAAERFSLSPAPFETLLEVRQGSRRLSDGEILPLFADYLHHITATAQQIDRL